jgi:uncharacterized linocin/CFP29 family protein
MDFIYNGQVSGDVASRLMQTNFDVNSMRPYVGADGRSYVTVNDAGVPKAVPVLNAAATLRKDEWIQLDQAIVAASKPRLRAVADLRSRGLEFVIPNGMAKTVLQTQTQSDISDAEITMDGLEKSKGDRPHYDLGSMPLPIIHKDFSFSAREIAASRNGSSPLDTTMAALAGRKVSEIAEKLLIGSVSTFTFGGGSLFGYTNFSSTISATITSPVASGWTAKKTVTEVLTMIQASISAYHFGPWVLYYGPAWSQYMNDEYKDNSDDTLADRLRRIDNVEDVSMLDYLSGYDLVLVQMTSDVVREVVGMDITTVQWESDGGFKYNFKVMAIMCPQLRTDFNGKTGIVLAKVI